MASKSTENYNKNSESKDNKNAYNRKFYKEHKEKLNKSRAERKKFRENNDVPKDYDVAHTKNGLRKKHKSLNRGSKGDSAGDRRARG